MKRLFTFLFLFVCSFALVLTSANAAKDTKKETKEETAPVLKEVEGKPTLYLFRRTGCSHCADELEYLGKNYDKLKEKINIVVYDYYVDGNQDITTDVVEALNVNPDEFGFPFNVIGTKQFMGYADSIKDDFEAFIDDAINTEKTDLVATLIETKNYENLNPTDLQGALDAEGIKVSADGKSNDGLVIGIFFGVIAIGLAGLVIYSRKQ